MADEYVLPTSSKRVFDDAGEADIVNDALPVQRVDEVTQALGVVDAGNVVFVWQDHRLRTGDSQLRGQGCLEELVVRCPHEGIVDDCCTLKNCILEIEAIVWYLMRDTIDDHRVGTWLVHTCAA